MKYSRRLTESITSTSFSKEAQDPDVLFLSHLVLVASVPVFYRFFNLMLSISFKNFCTFSLENQSD